MSVAIVRHYYSTQDNFLFDIERLSSLRPEQLSQMSTDVRECMVDAAREFITAWQPALLALPPQEPLPQSCEHAQSPAPDPS